MYDTVIHFLEYRIFIIHRMYLHTKSAGTSGVQSEIHLDIVHVNYIIVFCMFFQVFSMFLRIMMNVLIHDFRFTLCKYWR